MSKRWHPVKHSLLVYLKWASCPSWRITDERRCFLLTEFQCLKQTIGRRPREEFIYHRDKDAVHPVGNGSVLTEDTKGGGQRSGRSAGEQRCNVRMSRYVFMFQQLRISSCFSVKKQNLLPLWSPSWAEDLGTSVETCGGHTSGQVKRPSSLTCRARRFLWNGPLCPGGRSGSGAEVQAEPSASHQRPRWGRSCGVSCGSCRGTHLKEEKSQGPGLIKYRSL